MDGIAPVIAAVVTTIGSVIVAWLGARKYVASRPAAGNAKAIAQWRERAELEATRAELLEEQRDDARAERDAGITERATMTSKLTDTQHDLDNCARQLSNARAELRQIHRRQAPRGDA